jgi:hypothetical protein
MKQGIKRPGKGILPLLLLALGMLAMASACGYRVVGSEPVGGGQRKATLVIPPFENRSLEVGLETIFANDMIRAFQDSKVLQVKPGEATADYLLLGTIKKLEHSSTAYLDINSSLIRRTTLTVEFTLKDTKQNKVIWKGTEIVKSDYVANQFYGVGEATRDQGIRQVSVRLAQRINDKISLLF